MERTKLKGSFQKDIVFRMFGEDMSKLEAFQEEYNGAKLTNSVMHGAVPTPEEFEIAQMWLRAGAAATAREKGMTINQVEYIVTRVSRYQMKQNG